MTDDTTETLKDVSHTPPTGEPVSAVWERGVDPEASTGAGPADD